MTLAIRQMQSHLRMILFMVYSNPVFPAVGKDGFNILILALREGVSDGGYKRES